MKEFVDRWFVIVWVIFLAILTVGGSYLIDRNEERQIQSQGQEEGVE